MDDLGNIVYVIAVVGYLIYRAVGGAKKKPQQQPTSAPRKKGTTIEDILKELTEQQEVEPVVVEPEPIKEPPRRAASVERTDPHRGHVHDPKPFLDFDNPHQELAADYEMSSSEMGSHRIKRKHVEVEEPQEKNSTSEYINELSEGIDLKKAIIYRTILETPYIQRV